MTALAYTPAAVAIIRGYVRKGFGVTAISRHLGWDEPMTLRVARRHGIDLVAVPAADTKNLEETPEADLAPALKWDASNRLVKTGRGKVILSEQQAKVFGVLTRSGSACLSADDLAERCGVSKPSARATAKDLRHKLRPLGLVVVGQMGRHGGYRLERDQKRWGV